MSQTELREAPAAGAVGPAADDGVDPALLALAPLSEEQEVRREPYLKAVGKPRALGREEAREVIRDACKHADQVLDVVGRVMKGAAVRGVTRLVYQSILGGYHSYLQGTSGTGKTTMVELLAEVLEYPCQLIQGGLGDLTDLKIVGDEKIGPDGRLRVDRGFLTQPYIIICIIDEAARMQASAASLCLEAMSNRAVHVTLSGRGSVLVRLSPFFVVACAANPFTYGGSATKVEAFLDRIGQGGDMTMPNHEERREMLRNRRLVKRRQTPHVPPPFTLHEFRAALEHVEVSDELLDQIINISYLVSPPEYRRSNAWDSCLFKPMNRSQQLELQKIEELSTQILVEGSNPRGEELILLNSLTSAAVSGRMHVNADDVRAASRAALRFRLKPYPSCDERVPELLSRAVSLVFGNG